MLSFYVIKMILVASLRLEWSYIELFVFVFLQILYLSPFVQEKIDNDNRCTDYSKRHYL